MTMTMDYLILNTFVHLREFSVNDNMIYNRIKRMIDIGL